MNPGPQGFQLNVLPQYCCPIIALILIEPLQNPTENSYPWTLSILPKQLGSQRSDADRDKTFLSHDSYLLFFLSLEFDCYDMTFT